MPTDESKTRVTILTGAYRIKGYENQQQAVEDRAYRLKVPYR